MKTLKKLFASLFAVMLGASLMAAPAAAAFADEASNAAADAISQTPNISTDTSNATPTSQPTTENLQYVIDESGLLTATEIDSLMNMGQSVAKNHNVSAYYVTTNTLGGYSNAADYAEEYANEHGLLVSGTKGSIVFLVCVNEGKYSLVTLGDGIDDIIPQSTLEHLSNDLFPYLGRSDWNGAGETFFDDVGQTLSGKTANATSNVAYNGTYVVDNYGLFNDEQRATLEAKATELAQKYNMGVYLLVVDKMNGLDNPTSSQRTNFATSFYRANDLGLGSGKDGVMLVLAVDSRDYVTIAYGQGSYSFSDEGIEVIEEAVKDELRSNDWYEGANAYYDKVGEQLEYYSVRGKPWTEPDPLSFILKILAILGIPAGVAFSSVKSQESAMKTAREKTEATNYLVPNSLVMLQSTDSFSHTTHVVTPIPKHESSSGSGFGGGGWGGGGGGGFSSSGGGKF